MKMRDSDFNLAWKLAFYSRAMPKHYLIIKLTENARVLPACGLSLIRLSRDWLARACQQAAALACPISSFPCLACLTRVMLSDQFSASGHGLLPALMYT